jgi:anti-sigma B factor antagonist
VPPGACDAPPVREFSKFSAHHSTVVMSFGSYERADVVWIGGSLDLNTHHHVRSGILKRDSFQQPLLVLELSELSLLDSSGIGSLVLIHRSARERGAELAVVTDSNHLRKLLRIAGLDQVLTVHPSLDDALADHGPDDSEPASAG